MISLNSSEYRKLHSLYGDRITKRRASPIQPEEVAQYFIGRDLFMESHKDKVDKSVWGITYYLSEKFINLYEEMSDV